MKTYTSLKRKVSELERELQETDAEQAARISKLKAAKHQRNAYKVQLKSLRQLREKDRNELQVVEKAFIQGFENNFSGTTRWGYNTVLVKRMGTMDTEEDWNDDLWAACTTNTNDEYRGAEVKEFIKFWEDRVQAPDFDASICEDDGDGNLKYTIREDHEELNQVLENYGPKVYGVVCNAHLQAKEYGFGTPVLWHYGENKKAILSQVVERRSIRLEPKQ